MRDQHLGVLDEGIQGAVLGEDAFRLGHHVREVEGRVPLAGFSGGLDGVGVDCCLARGDVLDWLDFRWIDLLRC